MPTEGASAGQVNRLRGSRTAARDATVRVMESTRDRPSGSNSAAPQTPDAETQDSGLKGGAADLLTIALLVFFVSMLLIVAAMLALPAIVG